MRLFSSTTPKSSPELVRHSQVSGGTGNDAPTDSLSPSPGLQSRHNFHFRDTTRQKSTSSEPASTPPREHSPALVRGVSTLGRKFSRRFEKFGDSETARRLRMASPSRKYQWSISSANLSLDGTEEELQQQQQQQNKQHHSQKKRVSRVDSFRNFFSLATSTVANSTLRTPRAVKRRSRNTESKRQSRFIDVGTSTGDHGGGSGGGSKRKDQGGNMSAPNSLPGGLNSRFGSELTLTDCQSDLALSDCCQSEADLRYYCTTEDEDDRSVVSDGYGGRPGKQVLLSRSAGNLRLGILPENRTINFQEPGIYTGSNWMEIKSYGMIDAASSASGSGDEARKVSNESGYGSSDNASGSSPNSSSRASPRASIDGEAEVKCSSSDGSLTPPIKETGAVPDIKKQQQQQQPPLGSGSSGSSSCLSVLPPKKPARTSKTGSAQPQRRSKSLTDEEKVQIMSSSSSSTMSTPTPGALSKSCSRSDRSVKDYKMIKLIKPNEADELGIIIAKKKLKEIQTTGFQIVHIEPTGLIDR